MNTIGSWGALSELDLSSNVFGGRVPPRLFLLPRLVILDLSDNSLGGVLPMELQGSVQLLRLAGNPGLVSPDNTLPRFVVPLQAVSTAVDANGMIQKFSCPQLAAVDNPNAIVELDPSYYGSTICRCDPGTFGSDGVCHDCPAGMACPGGEKFVIPPGFYPLPNPEQPQHAQACRNIVIEQTPCNPRGLVHFECAKGYRGRLCSQVSALCATARVSSQPTSLLRSCSATLGTVRLV